MCIHCESEENLEHSVQLSRFVDGFTSQNGPEDRSSIISRIVEGSEDESSSHYVTATRSLKYRPPLASATRSSLRSPPVASSTLIDGRFRSRLRSTPLASSTILDDSFSSGVRSPTVAAFTPIDTRCRSRLRPSPLASSTLIHSSGTSEDSGRGGSIDRTHDLAPRKHRRRSLGLFRTSTRIDLGATDDLGPGSNTSHTRRMSLNGEQKRNMPASGTKQLKKKLLKKFLSFSDSANRSELCTFALL